MFRKLNYFGVLFYWILLFSLQVIVGLNQSFKVADHDFSRGSITPSVTMLVDTPETANESFYQGEVHVCLKDAVFEPSSPFRHAAELTKILNKQASQSPVLVLYTDGGPDHRCNYLSVIYTMVYLMLYHDLDALVLARNAPGHSWRNPAERVMSVLNLGLQAFGVMRQETTMEEEIKK